MIYLDNAATSKRKPFCVLQRFFYETAFRSSNAGRGSGKYSLGALRRIIRAQESLARLLNIPDPERICFTYNATYALNMALGGLLKNTLNGEAVVSQMDHNSVLRPAALLGKMRVIPADKRGYTDINSAERLFNKNTAVCTCTHASNVCGSIQDINGLCRKAHKHNIPFVLDAAQSAGCTELDAEKTDADIIAFSGHKGLMGPLGTGILYVKKGFYLPPYITGGTGSLSMSLSQPEIMPDMYHSGTLNTPAIAALGKAADFIYGEGIKAIAERESELAAILCEDLKNIPGVSVFGETGTKNRNGTVSFLIDGLDSAEAGEILERSYNICVRSGFHCAPLAHKALGTQKSGCIRASFGFFDSVKKEKLLAKAVNKIAGKIRRA